MSRYWKHFKTVCKHKAVVFHECKKCGLFWRGFVHDMSKFGPTEFFSSARYFQGTRSPIEAEKEAVGYSKAWLHHKSHNKHHWEYWTDFDENGSVIANRMPVKYVIEMVCDWVGAGKVYSKTKWTQNEPWKYYLKVKKGRYFHPDTQELVESCLLYIGKYGLKEFHAYARKLLKDDKVKGGKT